MNLFRDTYISENANLTRFFRNFDFFEWCFLGSKNVRIIVLSDPKGIATASLIKIKANKKNLFTILNHKEML